MTFTVSNPFISFVRPETGKPLGLGLLYVGVKDTDPEISPVTVYMVQPDGSEVVMSQPINLSAGGVATFNGSPVQIKIAAQQVSIKVELPSGVPAYYTARWNVPSFGMITRDELADPNTDIIIAGVPAKELVEGSEALYESVADMIAESHNEGTVVRCKRYLLNGPVVNLSYISRGDSFPTTADGYIDHTDTGGNYLQLISDEIGPEMAGAVGDGVQVDQLRMQKAADYCATNKKALVLNSGYTFGLNGYLQIKNGCTGFIGKGGKLKSIGPLFCGVMLAGKKEGFLQNVKGCTVRNIILDCNGIPGTGIFASNVSDCIIEGNQINNVTNGYGVLSRCWISGAEDAVRNTITNNTITLYQPVSASDPLGALVYGIALDSEINYSPYADAPAYWKATKTDKPASYVNAYSTVSDNTVLGGYYGLQLDSARYCHIVDNNTTNNVRGISVQHGCLANVIDGNSVIGNTSGGIHLAYASIYNTVTNNIVYSSRANQQALLNCYVGCAGNKFANNSLTAAGSASPNWYIYCGVNCANNVFEENTINGPCQKAYIAVESAWNNAVTNPASYGFGEGTEVNGFASTPTIDNVVSGNVIYPTNAKPAIFLSQINQGGGVFDLARTVVDNNKVMSNIASYQLELFEMQPGGISFTRLTDNSFDGQALRSKFVLPRGQLSFIEYKGNQFLNNGTVDLPPNLTTQDASVGAVVQHTDSSSTNVTNYTNCNTGSEIIVRLTVNTTLVNNASFLRLKGGVDISGSSAGGSNALVCLRNIGGVWFEQWRNF